MVLRAYMLLFLHTFCPGEKFDFFELFSKNRLFTCANNRFYTHFCPIALICAQDGAIRLGSALRAQDQHQIDV